MTYNAGESGTRSTNFNDIQFSKAGRYSFTIKELTNDAAGYQYDTKGQGPWTLTVEIEDEGGALVIKSVSYKDKDGTTVTGENARAEFTNSYTVKDTTYIPAVTKKDDRRPETGGMQTLHLPLNRVTRAIRKAALRLLRIGKLP